MGDEESGRQRRGGRSVSAADLQRGDAGLRAPGKHTLSELPRMPPVDPVTEVQYQLGQARARIATIESALSAGESRRAALAATELKVHLHHARDAATFAHDQGHERGAELIAQVAEVEQRAHPAIEAAKATSTDPAAIASRATRAGGGRLPHLERIQQSFGSHDVSSIQAHVGGDASDAAQQLGAHAFAFGDHVAFASEPDLHTAAHEAAHVVQQRAGVALAGGIDQPGDPYEQHADQVADAVVRGESAAPLLDAMAGRGASAAPARPPVQRKSFAERLQERALTREFDSYVDLNAPRLALAVVDQLAAHLWPDPAKDVPFLPGGERKFGAYLGESLRPYLHPGTALRQLLHPSDILAQFEALISNPRLGTSWSEQFGITLAHRVQAAATASLQQRVGPRYRAALAQMVQLPTADDLIAGHPIDPLVAQALIAPHVLDNTQVAQTEKPAAQLRKLEVHWLGRTDTKLWNFVQVSPGSATVEEVAAALWRDPKKTTEAYAIQKYGDVFRVAPAQARQVIRAHHPGEVIASSDTDGNRAAQLLDLARSKVKRGDAAARQFAGAETQAARVEDVTDIERQIGGLLDQIRAAVAPVGMAADLQIAYSARAERDKLLADGDASTRAKFLPVLQFQHTQLLTIAPKVPPLATQLKVLEGLGPGVLRQRKALREQIKTYVQAAALSHLRDEGSALLRTFDEEARYQTLNHLSGGQVDLHASNSEALASTGRTEKGSDEADENLERVRTAAMNGWASGLSQYEQQKALATAGEVALRARMRSAEHTLEQLQAAAIEAFGDPEAMHRMYPGLQKSLPELIADVRTHLADVNTTWTNATHEHTPAVVADKNAPADWASWQGRIAGLDAARTAFGKIAGDQSISSFIRKAQKEIQHEQFVSALIKLGAVLLITVATGMAAAELGATVSSQLAAEGAGLAARFGATVLDIGINASINTAVQMALSDETKSFGWACLENALMDLFTRGMMRPLQKLETAARIEAHELSMLPHLSAIERQAVASVNFAGTQLVVEMVGGMATQWAAHRLVQMFHPDALNAQKAGQPGGARSEQSSAEFANTVLQQGAAIGLGKFFHGRLAAWQQHRALLAQTRVGQLPEALPLFKAREQFYVEAKQLSESLSPDPAQGEKLMAQDQALLKQERALFESQAHSQEPTAAHDGAGGPPKPPENGGGKPPGGGEPPQPPGPPKKRHSEAAPEEAALIEGAVADRKDSRKQRRDHAGEVAAGEHVASDFLSDEQVDVTRWQNHGLEDDPRGRALIKDPAFRHWYELWMSMPDRLSVNASGELQIKFPRGIPENIAGQLHAVSEKGNVGLMTRAMALGERISKALPGVELDPTSPSWPSVREKLAPIVGEAAVAKFEREKTELPDAPRNARVEVDRKLNQLLKRGELSALESMLPGAELYVTGSVAQASKPLDEAAADLDAIIVLADDTPARFRAEVEERLRGYKLRRRGDDVPTLELDAKVMTKAEFAGFSMLPTASGRTPLDNARINSTLWADAPGMGASGKDVHNHIMGVPAVDYFVDRVGGGSAVNVLEKAWTLIDQPDLKPTVKSELGAAIADVRNAQAAGMPPSAVDARARRGLERILAASEHVPFDHTYDLRDLLVQHFIDAPSESNPQGRYENTAVDTITTLHDQGVTSSEQSVSINKANKRFDEATMARAHERARAQGKDSELEFLAMLPTDAVLSAEPGNTIEAIPKARPGKEAPPSYASQVESILSRKDVRGIDFAGPEGLFTDEGKENFKKVLALASRASRKRGEAIVIRPHVGEGYDPNGTGEHVEIARKNLDTILAALKESGYRGPNEGVIVRFGHATHPTTGQLTKMAELGIIVESNVGSNLATGSILRADEHPLIKNIYLGVPTLLATDGQGVMSTILPAEYLRAAMFIQQFRTGRLTFEIDGTVLRFDELTPEQQARFSVSWLTDQVQNYEQLRKQRILKADP